MRRGSFCGGGWTYEGALLAALGEITGDNFLFCVKWLTGGRRFPFWHVVYAPLSFGAALQHCLNEMEF